MRSAVNQASNAANTAASVGAGEGANASAVGANLTPFLTQEMFHPEGIGQQGIGAETSAALGGAGGAASALNGEAMQRAAASRNSGGFQAALADAARSRDQAAAGASEKIEAGNEQAKLGQQQAGAEGLGNLYKTDTSGMLQSMGQEAPDVNSEVNASKTGWLQDASSLLQDAGGLATFGGNLRDARLRLASRLERDNASNATISVGWCPVPAGRNAGRHGSAISGVGECCA